MLHSVRFLQGPIASLISTLRAPKSAEGYAKIGGGSPLRQITEDQARALAQALARRGVDAKVYVGMRYWKPFMEDAMEKVGYTLRIGYVLHHTALRDVCRYLVYDTNWFPSSHKVPCQMLRDLTV